MNKKVNNKKVRFSTVLKEGSENSPFSARRFIAFILVIDSVMNTILALFHNVEDWHIYLVVMGVPLLVSTLLLFCTTVNDIVSITSSLKNKTDFNDK